MPINPTHANVKFSVAEKGKTAGRSVLHMQQYYRPIYRRKCFSDKTIFDFKHVCIVSFSVQQTIRMAMEYMVSCFQCKIQVVLQVVMRDLS